jgi:CRP/FNR family transcriptional regulator, cyclic AMP receptor protein
MLATVGGWLMSEAVDAQQLEGIRLFSGLPAEVLSDVAAQLLLTEAPVGEVVIAQDDLPTKLFLLFDGDVTVHRGGHHVADLHAGDVFGEAGTLSLEHRNATVIATTPARLGVLMGWELRDLAADSPELSARLDELTASRSAGD